MEKLYPTDFPDCALKYSIDIIKLLQCSEKKEDYIVEQPYSNLTALLEALKSIQVLKNNYNIVFPLHEYLKVRIIY